jgi:diguanylate cyclase (GGDEF)-like protein
MTKNTGKSADLGEPPAAERQRPAVARLSLVSGVATGFMVLVVLMSVLTWLALSRVAELNRNVTELVEVNNLKVTLATRMKNALRERAIIMHSMSVMMDPFKQDEEFLRFQDLGADFTAARTQLEFMASGEIETGILARMRELTFSTQPIVVEAINLALKQRRSEARVLIDREIIPRQKKLAAEIDLLLDIQQQAARETARSARDLANGTRTLMLILGGFALVVGAGIAAMVWRHAHRQQQRLERQALYDNLTELPNRRLFADRLDQAILAAEREHRAFGLLLLDLNRFKLVNDTLGHHVGDLVLRETAERVCRCLRAADTVARLGGDELAIVLPNTAAPEAVQAMADRLLESLFRPYHVDGREVELGASVGIAMYPEHGTDSETLQRHADAAMYHAKRRGIGCAIYQSDLESSLGRSHPLRSVSR